MVKKSTDGKVTFREKSHKYMLGKTQLTSVTTLIHNYFRPFDEKGLARKLASFRWAKEAKKGVRYWLNLWKQNREEGTLFHEELEIYVKNPELGQILYPVFHKRSQSMVDWLVPFLNDHKDFHAEPELLVYDEEFGVAGQIDLPLIKGNKIIICDYKFTNSIKKTPYEKDDFGIKEATKDIANCNYNTYSLQLSMYGYLLERQGFSVQKLVLLHCSPDGLVTPYELPYLRDVVKSMLEDKNE